MYSWGSKPYSRISSRIAEMADLPHIRLEDGFVCSFGRSSRATKYSIVVDPVGIYYDATNPSRLENILNGIDAYAAMLADGAQLARAQRLIERVTADNVSKYNYLTTTPVSDLPDDMVLVIDQTVGDQSVHFGGMDQQRFEDMLQHALAKYPANRVVVKVHPDVLAGKKQGYLTTLASELNLRVLTADLTAEQLSACTCVYTGTSLMGMEALLRGVQVECFGQPFYAGWGLTRDHNHMPARQQQRSLKELFLAAYVLYPDYIDPVTGEHCELEDTLAHLAVQRQQRKRISRQYTCVGITPWKKRYLDRYLQSADFTHRHVSTADLMNTQSAVADTQYDVLVWGKKENDSPLEQALQHQRVARMEDGFLRSVGLGSNFTAPRSLVIDDLGIYFDATQPSRLEQLLQNHTCTDAELQRAGRLMEMLLENRITKYDIADNDEASGADYYRDNKVKLVVGQVDGDASLRYGTADIAGNPALIEAVRAANPDAVVVYKPHPDVVSGNRSDGIDNKSKVLSLCDHIETELPIHTVMRLCEEIHTMTSLAGMEALLMGKRVVTYGMPFYAGWGLTTDRCQFERRKKMLTIQELVYISYILYPSYLDVESGEFTSAEKTIDSLLKERTNTAGSLTATGLEKYVNMVRNIKKGLTYAA
ncbi:MAG: capsular polysaccharide biosynthesis protein [Pseudomonadota bacterium]